MKRFKHFTYLLLLSAISISSCKKDSNTDKNDTNTFPTPISNIAPQSMIDSLRAAGATVYGGTNPPIVNGIYLMTPDSCVYDDSPLNGAGTYFADYKFQFTNQNNTSFTLNVDQKNMSSGDLSPVPVSTFISGDGNNFSIFILRTVSPTGIAIEQFNVFSGTLTAGGIQNFHNTFYLRSKGSDPTPTLPPAGTIRRFVTGGTGLAVSSTTF